MTLEHRLPAALRTAETVTEPLSGSFASRASLDRGILKRMLIGEAPQIIVLRERILNFAATDADVLVHGETGAGKDVVARGIHECSTRKSGRFVALNCGALPESVIESELFGHEAGAFTGASKSRVGKIEYAHEGTIFLDEIESMPLALQVRLLRVLQDRVVTRLGSNEERAVNIRVIAATKEDLLNLGERREFRLDLYHRLNVLKLVIPPLRDRPEDIVPLFMHFAGLAASRFKTNCPGLSEDESARLKHHPWTGNVRELQNAALRFALGLGVEELSPEPPRQQSSLPSLVDTSLAGQLSAAEREIVSRALARNGFCLKSTYRELAISRKTLYDKMRRFQLSKPVVARADG